MCLVVGPTSFGGRLGFIEGCAGVCVQTRAAGRTAAVIPHLLTAGRAYPPTYLRPPSSLPDVEFAYNGEDVSGWLCGRERGAFSCGGHRVWMRAAVRVWAAAVRGGVFHWPWLKGVWPYLTEVFAMAGLMACMRAGCHRAV